MAAKFASSNFKDESDADTSFAENEEYVRTFLATNNITQTFELSYSLQKSLKQYWFWISISSDF